MTFRRMFLTALVSVLSVSASANQITENWEVVGEKGIERLNEDCGLSTYSATQLSILGGFISLPAATLASATLGTPASGLPTVVLGAVAIGASAGLSLSVAYTGDKSEFINFIDDLQSGLETVRVQKFRDLAAASNISFEDALKKLNELIRSEKYCTAETTLKSLENLN